MVEQVRDGSTLRVELIPGGDLPHKMVWIHLPGCAAPSMPISQDVFAKQMKQWEQEKSFVNNFYFYFF